MGICRIEQGADAYKITGLLNHQTVSQIYQEGIALLNQADLVRFDFGFVTHADSSAIAMLLSWIRYAKKQQKTFVFANLPVQVVEMANVCEVMPLLERNFVT